MNVPYSQSIAWHAHEFEHQYKSSDWYWGLGVVVIVIAAAAIFFGNILLAIIIVLAGLVGGLMASKHDDPTHFAITPRGVIVEDTLYPYQTLDSFFVEDIHDNRAARLLIKSRKPFMPLLVIPIEDVEPEEVADYLSQYMDEDEHTEPIAHKLFEKLGF